MQKLRIAAIFMKNTESVCSARSIQEPLALQSGMLTTRTLQLGITSEYSLNMTHHIEFGSFSEAVLTANHLTDRLVGWDLMALSAQLGNAIPLELQPG